MSLFSGIGGIDFALKEWMRTQIYCEIDPYCQGVLLSRMASGDIENAPIWDDIKTLQPGELGAIDIIVGGFPPCQDISIAGNGKGLAGERSGLFFEIIRLVREIRPTFVFLENTKGILTNGGVQVIETLTSIGYSCRWITKSCKEVGSPQNRERWFCLAYSGSIGLQKEGLAGRSKEKKPKSSMHVKHSLQNDWPENKSPLLGVDVKLPFWMDRIKCLGNSVCINQTREAFKELIGFNMTEKIKISSLDEYLQHVNENDELLDLYECPDPIRTKKMKITSSESELPPSQSPHLRHNGK
jgi:DNA (cytosine-5)-methyltransferase 1